MKVKVTDQGVVIPKELLEGVEEVEISQENGLIFIKPTSVRDPILGLGKNPIDDNVSEHEYKNATFEANPDPLAEFIGAVSHGALAQNTDSELYES